MAKTIEAAPLNPDHDTSSDCLILHFIGVSIPNVTIGLAISIRKSEIASAVGNTLGNADGKESSPKKEENKHLHKSCQTVKEMHHGLFIFYIGVTENNTDYICT